jgi:3-dehydroquinate dehydratase
MTATDCMLSGVNLDRLGTRAEIELAPGALAHEPCVVRDGCSIVPRGGFGRVRIHLWDPAARNALRDTPVVAGVVLQPDLLMMRILM